MVKKILFGFVAVVALAIFIKVWPFVQGDPTKIIVAQPMFGGDMYCIEGGGWHWKGLAKTYSYTLVNDFYFNSSNEKVNGKMWEGDDTDEDDIHVTFAKKAEGDVRGHLQYFLPTDCEKMVKLHKEKHSDEGIKHNLVRNKVIDAITGAAVLYNGADVIETKKIEFRDMIKTHLNVGMYLTYTDVIYEKVGKDEVDSNGKVIKEAEKQKYEITKLKLDTLGNPILKTESDLIAYGITVGTPEIVGIKLDDLSRDRIKKIRDKEMTNIENAAKAETAKQTAITKEAEGRARVAEEKANQEVEKIREVTKAEKEKAVAVMNAEKAFKVAEYEAKTAIENAKKIRAEGEAQAAIDAAKRRAGLSPEREAEIRKETIIGVAQALATSPQKWVPDIMITGDNGKSNANPMDAVGLNMLMDITNRMAK